MNWQLIVESLGLDYGIKGRSSSNRPVIGYQNMGLKSCSLNMMPTTEELVSHLD